MKSPTPPPNSDHGVPMHRLVTPTARLFAATVILITGTGVSAVFWKMPNGMGSHALYHEGIVDKNLSAVPLPSDAVAAISQDEMKQMELPTLDFMPTVDGGAEKYAQYYQTPEAVAMLNIGQDKVNSFEEEEYHEAMIPQKFEPVRHIVEKKPIAIEPVSRKFMPKPTNVNVSDRSDDLFLEFQFVGNNRGNFGIGQEPEQPADPFPVAAASLATLAPLKPLLFDDLPPLLPLQESKL